MKNHEIQAAILRIQSEQIALYPEIPAEYYSIYRYHKPREPAQTGDNKALTEQAEHDIIGDIGSYIGRKLARIAKKMRRKIKC